MAGYRVTLTCKVCNTSIIDLHMSSDRLTDWPTHECATVISNSDIMPLLVHSNLLRYIVDGGTSETLYYNNEFLFMDIQGCWERRSLEVGLYFRKISLVSSELQSISFPFYLLLPRRKADVGSVPRKKENIFGLVLRTLNSDLEHGQTRTTSSSFLLSAHCLGRLANYVSCGKEYDVRVPFQNKSLRERCSRTGLRLTVTP
jgi:hypothetical protein